MIYRILPTLHTNLLTTSDAKLLWSVTKGSGGHRRSGIQCGEGASIGDFGFRGFALEYDFRPTLTHPLPRVGFFPVVYSEERYDASAYLTWAFLKIMGVKAVNPDMMASIKAALFKSKQWEYEKEWRMIDPGPHDILNPAPSVMEYRPVAIYYGRNIEAKNRERLHEIAAAKGIKEYEMVIDYAGERYEMGIRGYEVVE